MSLEHAVILALITTVFALVGKILFDWLKPKNGNGHCAYKTDHDVQLRHNIETTMLLQRIFDNCLINQELLREIKDELKEKK